MHEIKSPFLILMEEQSYLAQSLESAFEKQNSGIYHGKHR